MQECSISEKEWVSKIRFTLKMVHDIDFEKMASQTLWGIRLVILVKPEHTNKITHIQASQVRTGIGNALGKICKLYITSSLVPRLSPACVYLLMTFAPVSKKGESLVRDAIFSRHRVERGRKG